MGCLHLTVIRLSPVSRKHPGFSPADLLVEGIQGPSTARYPEHPTRRIAGFGFSDAPKHTPEDCAHASAALRAVVSQRGGLRKSAPSGYTLRRWSSRLVRPNHPADLARIARETARSGSTRTRLCVGFVFSIP